MFWCWEPICRRSLALGQLYEMCPFFWFEWSRWIYLFLFFKRMFKAWKDCNWEARKSNYNHNFRWYSSSLCNVIHNFLLSIAWTCHCMFLGHPSTVIGNLCSFTSLAEHEKRKREKNISVARGLYPTYNSQWQVVSQSPPESNNLTCQNGSKSTAKQAVNKYK